MTRDAELGNRQDTARLISARRMNSILFVKAMVQERLFLPKHDRTKAEQQMVGQQLLEFGKQYTPEKIATLDEEFRKTVSVKRVSDIGVLDENKKSEERKAAHLAAKIAKRTREPKTLGHFQDKAAAASVNNDATWQDPSTNQRVADLDRLASDSFWNSQLRVNNANPEHRFHAVLKNVLPDFWKDDMQGKAKSRIMPDLKEYLHVVRAIAAEKGPDEYHGVLELFVKVDETTYLSAERTDVQKFQENANALLVSCGKRIHDKFKRLGGRTEEDWDNWDAEDGEDLSDDEEDDEEDIDE